MRASRALLRDEEVSFQAVKTWKTGTDPGYEAKTARGLQLYAIAEGTATPGPRDPTVVFGVPWSSASMSSGR